MAVRRGWFGDAVMAVFGIPTLHEDDALRAVRAAAQIGARLERLNAELGTERGAAIRFRTGVNTGPVVAGDPGRSVGRTRDARGAGERWRSLPAAA